MSLWKRLLGKSDPPKQRIRVCVECGMPIAEHKEWCSIRRGEFAYSLGWIGEGSANDPNFPTIRYSDRFHDIQIGRCLRSAGLLLYRS